MSVSKGHSFFFIGIDKLTTLHRSYFGVRRQKISEFKTEIFEAIIRFYNLAGL